MGKSTTKSDTGITHVKCAALERIFHVSQQMISEYVKAGMPRPDHGKYDLEACVTWWVDRNRAAMDKKLSELGREEQETRLKRAQAEKQELHVAQMKRELVTVDSVNDEYGRVVSAARSRLLSMSSKLAPVVIACTSAIDAQMAIDGAVREVLHELGTADFAKPQPMATTAEPDNEPMGGRKPRPVARSKRRAGAVGNVEG